MCVDCEEKCSEKTKPPIDVSLGREHRSFPAEGGKAWGSPWVTLAAPLLQFVSGTVIPVRRMVLQSVQAAAPWWGRSVPLRLSLQAALHGSGHGQKHVNEPGGCTSEPWGKPFGEMTRAMVGPGGGTAPAPSKVGSRAWMPPMVSDVLVTLSLRQANPCSGHHHPSDMQCTHSKCWCFFQGQLLPCSRCATRGVQCCCLHPTVQFK